MIETRPLPQRTEVSAPFWDAAADRRLVIQRCAGCERFQFPPRLTCAACGSPEITWVEVSGEATLYSWVICHSPMLPWFEARGPWPVAAVELAEGVRMVTNLVGVEPEDYEFGMPLEVTFADVEPGKTLVQFRPRST
jgi:uncharacterized OB-fold protein